MNRAVALSSHYTYPSSIYSGLGGWEGGGLLKEGVVKLNPHLPIDVDLRWQVLAKSSQTSSGICPIIHNSYASWAPKEAGIIFQNGGHNTTVNQYV